MARCSCNNALNENCGQPWGSLEHDARQTVPALRKRLFAAVLLAVSGAAQALPEGGEVVAGDADIAINGDTMNINQSSQRAIINFQSFDVAGQQTVNFNQPSSEAVVLNRVVGSNLSEIHGAINANGQVYLINPNGVVFGNGAQVNVGGLVVSTLDIADRDFLEGRDAFAGAAEGTVENRGTIDAQGRVVLLAPEVVNRGDIRSTGGDITLRGSRKALLHSPGSEIPILLDSSDFVGQVSNEGTVHAGDIALILDGASQRDVYDAAINNSGLLRAVRASGSGGSIELLAPGGDVVNSGTLDASATDGNGGRVNIDAERVFQTGAVTATAAGIGHGGDINLHASEGIAMHSGSAIDANGGTRGDGGNVVVLSQSATWFTEDASINARGGEESGDGGFVEVSGMEFVSVAGSVDVGATNGEGGLWYIDPTDITITSNLDNNGSFMGSDPATWTLQGAPATSLINVTTLLNTLNNNSNVLISTVSGGSGQGNITFDAALDYNGIGSGKTLTLQADNQIIFTENGRISDSASASADGLNLVADAQTGFSMHSAALINVGQGTINISTAAGNAVITGLTSRLNVAGTANAGTAVQSVSVSAPAGSITSANPSTADIDVKDSGLTLNAMGDIGELLIESNFIDVVSATGNITLRDPASTSVYRMQTPATAFITTGSQFAVELATPFAVQNLHVTAGTDFRIDDAGFSILGNLTVTANNLRGNAGTVGAGSAAEPIIMSASTADITLTNGTLSRYWTTSFDQLAVNISGGTGDLTVVDTDTLTLNSVTNGGNTSFFATNGDLALTAAPVVVGILSLATVGSGNIVLPEAGLNHSGNLTVEADNLVDGDNAIIVGAANADITLRDGSLPSTWATGFDQLVLNIAGASDLSITDSDGLTLAAVNTAGSASFSTTNADLVVAAAPVIGGNLGLNTVGSGNVVIPDAGLSYTGNVSVVADNLVDSDSDITLAAATADITLRDTTALRSWTTSLGQLALNLASTGAFSLVDADGLTLTSVATGGNASFSAPNADLVLTSAPAVVGALSLTTVGTGDVVLPDVGLAHSGNLTVLADNLHDTDLDVTLAADTADITLRDGASASSWTTDFNQLLLDIAGAGALSLTDSDGLILASIATGGSASFSAIGANLVLTAAPAVGGDLSLSTIGSGNVVIPDAGLSHTGNVSVVADNLVDSDSDIALAAATADITLRDTTAVRSWTTSLGQLALNLASTGAFSLVDADGLTLTAVATSGDASFSASNADLVLTSAPAVVGALSLTTVGTGDVVLPDAGLAHSGNLTVLADNLHDTDLDVTLAADTADITLRDGASASSWTTDFNQLLLDIAGAGALSLTDSDGLILASIATGGSASFSAIGANLVLTAAPAVGGDLSLSTIGSGNVIIPSATFGHSGGVLTIAADDLMDADRNLTLDAVSADITLRGAGGNHVWATSFGTLTLTMAGLAHVEITDSDSLSLGSVSLGGSGSFNSTGADLVFTAAPTVAGDLNVSTIGSGDVVVASAGLSSTGNLTVLADNLAGAASTLTLGAANADITLRDGAAAQAWNTSFDQLVLDIAGAGALSLTDSDGLTITSVATGGVAGFAATGADLVLTAVPAVAGNLRLSTMGSGNVIVPTAGLTHSGGTLLIDADDLLDTDRTLTLQASAADIALRNPGGNHSWTTSFNLLDVATAGAANLEVTDSDGLTLGNVVVGGSGAFAASGANLLLTAAPAVTGHLSLSAIGSGDVVLPDAGLMHAGDLAILADNVLDIDSAVTLGAANAEITLRDGAGPRAWSTSFDTLVLGIAGSGAFTLTDSDGLTLTSANTGGSASFNATNADLALTSVPVVVGALSLTTIGSGDVVLADAGLAHSGNLTVLADNLRDTNSNISLAAGTADITLRDGAAASSWTTDFNELLLDITGPGAISLIDNDGLRLTSVATGGSASFSATGADLVLTGVPVVGGDLRLSTVGSGRVIIPSAPFSHNGGALTVAADDLLDADRALTLEAASADITLRSPGGSHVWTTGFGSLDLTVAGAADIDVTDSDSLSLGRVALGGNGSFTATGADLVFTASPTVAGHVSVSTIGSGDVVIAAAALASAGNLTVLADNLVGSASTLALGAANADITLRDGAAAQIWSTSFDQLVLNVAGVGAVALTDSDGLTLTAVATGGNASYAATAADLILTAAPTTGGNLSLSTIGSGDVILPDGGLIQTGTLAVLADNLVDSDSTLTLAASNADIRLRDGAAAQTWNTSFDQLMVNIAGTGALALTDSDGLTLSSVISGGDASFAATGGDLVLIADPTVAGHLNLRTIGSGNLIVPNTGLSHAGALTIVADNLTDTDTSVALGATHADITLRDGTMPSTWATSFDLLTLAHSGAGNLTVSDADGLTLNSVITGGNASFSAANGDLALTTSPMVAGSLSLATVGSGNVVLPEAGLDHSGNLTLVADNLIDGDNAIIVGAANADITLRDGSLLSTWTTRFDQLVLDIAGASDLSLTDSNGLTLTAVNTAGSASFSTTNADLIVAAAPVIGGNLGLNTVGSGNVVIPDAGLSYTGNVSVVADNLMDSDADIILAAATADITLRDTTAVRNWTTSLGQLALNLASTGAFSLVDADGLTLTAVATGGNASFSASNADLVLTFAPAVAGALNLATIGTGDVVLPDAGLAHSGNLTVLADNLRDTDLDVALAADTADITLRDGASASSWTTNFNQLLLDITGAGALSLTDSDGLTLSSVTTRGSASFSATGADLVLTAGPAVGGDLSLSTIDSGDVIIPVSGFIHAGSLNVVADNLLDSDADLTLGASSADIRLRDGSAARRWNTAFDQLMVTIVGAGAFSLIDMDGLTLSSVTVGGDASFSATDADLVLTAEPIVAGHLQLSTLGSGNLLIPDTGLNHTGALTLLADHLADSDNTIAMSATRADVTLRGGALASIWTTDFDQLTLVRGGAGDLAVTDADGLTLNAVATGGNARFSANSADLILTAAPQTSGHLTLRTIDSGSLVMPAGGLMHRGALTLLADDLVGADPELAIGATVATVTLRDARAQSWLTSFDSLALAIAGANSIALTDSDGLTLTSATVGGDTRITTTDADLVLATNPQVAGNLSLITTGNGVLRLPETGLSHIGDLAVDAHDIMDTDRDIRLGAANGSIVLRGAGGDHTFATEMDSLSLNSSASFAIDVTDSDGLTLNTIATGGAARFASSAADLTVTSSPTVAGGLTLMTLGSGDLVIPEGGLMHGQALSITADSVRDSDSAVTFATTALSASLRNQQSAVQWTTTLNSLDLSLAGGGAFDLNNLGALTVSGLASDSATVLNASGHLQVDRVTALNDLALISGGDLSIADATLGGNVQLVTAPTGALTIADAGITAAGDLAVDAGAVRNSSGVNDTRWVANLASFRLRNTTAATRLDTQAAALSVTNDSTAALTLQVADAAQLNNLSSGGDVNVVGLGGLVLGSSTYAVAGELGLDLTDMLQLASGGLTVSNDVRIRAGALSATGGNPMLAGRSADVTLTGGGAVVLDTQLDQLGLTSSASSFSLNSDRSLTLTRFAMPSAQTVDLTVAGTLTTPDSGLSAHQRLTINAVDLRDGDRSLTLATPQLAVRLSGASGNNAWALTADELDVLMRGNASLAVTDADGLTLGDINNDGQSVLIDNGNFGLALTSGDLIVAANVSAADLSADGARSGIIDLAVAEGNLLVEQPSVITSSNSVDHSAGTSRDGIRLRLLDSGSAERSIRLGSSARLLAVGGDVLIDTRPAGTAANARRQFVQEAGSVVEAYNQPGEPQDGTVLMNGETVAAAAGQVIRSGRTLAIVTDAQKPPLRLDELRDEVGFVNAVAEIPRVAEAPRPLVAAQFEKAFGTCDELDKQNPQRCRVHDALKAFLSHWLVGGELPPKTEIH